MAEFKCISCGAVKESEKPCSCPVCGYKMFETPYERAEIFRKEIKDFIAHLKLSETPEQSFEIYRKEPKKKDPESQEFDIIKKADDDSRFPVFAKIQGYVCASTKTEMFYDRLNTSIEQIRKHIHENYAQDYQVSLQCIKDSIDALDSVLKEALSVIDIKLDIPEWTAPELKLAYCETPDDELLGVADKILDDLAALSDKIKKFIKQNNIYGMWI